MPRRSKTDQAPRSSFAQTWTLCPWKKERVSDTQARKGEVEIIADGNEISVVQAYGHNVCPCHGTALRADIAPFVSF